MDKNQESPVTNKEIVPYRVLSPYTNKEDADILKKLTGEIPPNTVFKASGWNIMSDGRGRAMMVTEFQFSPDGGTIISERDLPREELSKFDKGPPGKYDGRL